MVGQHDPRQGNLCDSSPRGMNLDGQRQCVGSEGEYMQVVTFTNSHQFSCAFQGWVALILYLVKE